MEKYGVLIMPYGFIKYGYDYQEAKKVANVTQSFLDILKNKRRIFEAQEEG